MNNLTVALIAVIAVLGGFYGGYRYESGKVATTAAAATTTGGTATGRTGAGTGAGNGTAGGGGFAGAGGGAGAGGFAGGRGNAGTVTNLTATGFTLHNANGADTKVTFAPGATVRMTVAGQLTDIKDAANVAVTGTRDASGNLVATTITIVPAAAPSPGG
jgi:YD repeat-containing protein